jgi:crotonobetainyl-CoA:carnitine CoA-transferase CaiB-like acyl-CoA transferase
MSADPPERESVSIRLIVCFEAPGGDNWVATTGGDGVASISGDGSQEQPLAGVKVVDFTHVLAGPYATMLLADAGAEVIKVESPTGDFARQRGVKGNHPGDESVSAYFVSVNRGKQSLAIDLKTESGRQRVTDLIADADVLVENFSLGTMARLGLDLNALRARYPRLITASISLYGSTEDTQDGKGRLGLAIVAEAEAGVYAQSMDPNDRPTPVSIALGDMVSGLACYAGIVTALVGRERTGQGRHVDISMVKSMLSLNAQNLVTDQMLRESGIDTPKDVLRKSVIAPWGFYTCEDGFIAIAVNNDESWRGLLEALGRSDLLNDERFMHRDNRNPRGEEVRRVIEDQTATMTRDTVLASLIRHRVPCGLVRRSWELSGASGLEAIGSFSTVDDGFGHEYLTPANPFGYETDGRSVPHLNDFEK